jgi:hypothetical protein
MHVYWARRTAQFVAVRGTLEKIQPSREGLSDARRTYLSVRMIVSPPKSHHRLCMSESRYGCRGQTLASDMFLQRMRLTGSRLCVRNYTLLSAHFSGLIPDSSPRWL